MFWLYWKPGVISLTSRVVLHSLYFQVVLTLQILLGSFMLTTLRNDICEGYESYESYEGYEGHESYESYEI